MLGQTSRWPLPPYSLGYPFTLVLNKDPKGKVNPGGVSSAGALWFFPCLLAAMCADWRCPSFLPHAQLPFSPLTALPCQAVFLQDEWQDLTLKRQISGQPTSLFLNSRLTASSRAAQKKAPCSPEITGGTTRPEFPARALCLKAEAALGMSGQGAMWKQLLCGCSCFGRAHKIPARINAPVTDSFVNKVWRPALRPKMGLLPDLK